MRSSNMPTCFQWAILGLCFALGLSGCTTKYGTAVLADRIVPSNAMVERVGTVAGVATAGGILWAKSADRALYERAKGTALGQRSSDLLLDVQVTTRLTSYLGLYYVTSVTVEGIAAKITGAPSPSGQTQ